VKIQGIDGTLSKMLSDYNRKKSPIKSKFVEVGKR